MRPLVKLRSPSGPLAYALALALPITALLVMLAVGVHARYVPFLFFYLAVVIVARVARYGPMLTSILSSALLAHTFLVDVQLPDDQSGVVSVVLFVIVATALGLLVQRMRSSGEALAASQAEVATKEERLRLALEAGGFGIWDWDIARDRVWWSDRVYEIHGLLHGEFAGGIKDFEALVHEDDRAGIFAALDEAMTHGTPYEVEFRSFRRDTGELRWIGTSGRAILDEHRKAIRMLGAVFDITDRKRLETDRERTRETFIAMLGHDLRNPLSPIMLGAQAMLRRASTEEEAQPIKRILSSGKRMVRMIEQLLDFTRSRLGGGIPIVRTKSDLRTICQQIVEEVRVANPTHRILFQYSGDGSGAWDPDRLAQVFSNLVGNAIHHGLTDAPIRVSLDEDETAVCVTIANAGVIAPALLPVIFDPFRGRELHDRESLGLGLFIAEQIVVAHRGHIDVTSTAESGTVFRVSLPKLMVRERERQPFSLHPS